MIQVEIIIHYETPRQSERNVSEGYVSSDSRETVVREEFLDLIDHDTLHKHLTDAAGAAAYLFNQKREYMEIA